MRSTSSALASHPARPSSLAVAALLAAMSTLSHAQTTRSWQNPSGGGDWGTSANWSGGAIPTALDTAQIGGLSSANTTPDLNGATFSVAGLVLIPRTSGFSASNFTIQSTGSQGTLELGAAGIVVRNGGLATIASSVTLNLAADQNWGGGSDLPNIGTGLTVNGLITGSGKITLTDGNSDNTGAFTFGNGDNTFSGGFQINKRSAVLGAGSTVTSGALTGGPLGTGTVTLAGGTLRSNGATARTLHNNIVVTGATSLGHSSQTGALTFSDSGLATASTFTLGSSTNGAVSTLRAGGANLTFDQVIAETGGSGQGILFAATSGTPTVTLNRAKTAAGGLFAGGVNLVLANGVASSGSIAAVNGSVTATGSNKFSSGELISDAANIVATDTANFSEVSGDRARVYNNGRLGFATTQTQSAVAGLVSSDSRLRLGLGSGGGNATVAENYDQSALGDGRAGLVSASTGIITYNGVLGAGSDATYRLGGGAGTLALGTADTLAGANSLIVEGGGTLRLDAAQSYTGSTTVNSGLTLNGPSATINGSSAVAINNATLTVDNAGGAAASTDRFADSTTITLSRGVLSMQNSGSGTPPDEVFDTLAVNAGANAVNLSNTPAGTKSFSVTTLSRANNALVTFRGDSFGSTGGSVANRNTFRITGTAPALVGGGGAEGSTNVSIIPWARGNTGGGANFAANTFVTFDSTNQVIRNLSTTTEFAQASGATQISAAIGANTDRNVRVTGSATGTTTLQPAATSSTINALLVDNTGATAATTYSLNSNTLAVTGGAVHLQHSASQNLTLNSGTLDFGSAEGVITQNGNSFYLATVGTQIVGTGGLSVYTLNGGGVSLGGTTTSGFSGGFTFGGNGYLAVDQDQRFGNAANNITHGGGELRFFAGLTSTRGLTLLGNVGDNTLGNNNGSQTVTWNGVVSGSGRLRLINNASSASTTGFNLGGANTYSGGTQIEGINVTASNDSALGTGTVTLQGANNNAAALSLTSAAPALGGLRGTDGTVTINPSGGSATLAIGANNENTVFLGAIAQGAGKTGSLTKVGTGDFVLGGTASHTGTTTVSAGRFTVAGLVASSAVTVQSGATLALAGGRVQAVTVDSGAALVGSGTVGDLALNGELALGSSPGVLTLADGATLTFGSGSGSTFEFTSASFGLGSYDRVAGTAGGATESAVLAGTLNLVFSGGGYALGENVARIFDLGSIAGAFVSVSVSGLDTGLAATFDPATGYVSITNAIPEPSAFAALAGLGALGFAALRRRRA